MHPIARSAFSLVLGALVVSTGCAGSKQPSTVPSQGVAAATVTTAAIPVVTGSFVVEPRTYKDFKVVVPTGAKNPRLEGTFSASGARNDIEVTLLDAQQFQNWQNRHKFDAAYDSGRVTAGKIRVALPPEPGTYVVVFSNRFSFISNKAVVADLKLQYDSSR
jgi:hypothetical protein